MEARSRWTFSTIRKLIYLIYASSNFYSEKRGCCSLEIDGANDYLIHRNGLNMRPQPFECSITPRNEEIRQTIEREGKQALQELEQYRGETKYRMSTFYSRNDLAMDTYAKEEKE